MSNQEASQEDLEALRQYAAQRPAREVNRYDTITGPFSPTADGRPSRNTQKLGRIDISHSLLKSMLDIPEGCEIKYMHNDQARNDVISIIVKSEHCPETPEGAMIPIVSIQQLSGFDE